jgi:hypothetical protein
MLPVEQHRLAGLLRLVALHKPAGLLRLVGQPKPEERLKLAEHPRNLLLEVLPEPLLERLVAAVSQR